MICTAAPAACSPRWRPIGASRSPTSTPPTRSTASLLYYGCFTPICIILLFFSPDARIHSGSTLLTLFLHLVYAHIYPSNLQPERSYMLRRAVREVLIPGRTRLVMLESPTNPRMQICDLRTLTALAHEVPLPVPLLSSSLHTIMSAAKFCLSGFVCGLCMHRGRLSCCILSNMMAMLPCLRRAETAGRLVYLPDHHA